MKTNSSWRYFAFQSLLLILGLAVIGQMLRIQNSKEAKYFTQMGELYAGDWSILEPKRGDIYDRWGYPLATSKEVFEVGADIQTVSEMGNAQVIAEALSKVTGADYTTTLGKLSVSPEKVRYVILDNFISTEQKAELEQLKSLMAEQSGKRSKGASVTLAGLTFTPHLMRYYPEKELASNILGFVNHYDQVFYGVEQKQNELLGGTKKKVWVPRDPNMAEQLPEIRPGASIILTIDREIQRNVEDILDKALSSTGSEAGTIVVMDPETGEILAMATTPRMDLNQYENFLEIYPNPTPFNRAVSKDYEPGSVFKVLTMAAALDNGTVEPNTSFLDTGVFTIAGTNIYNWDRGAWGPQTMVGCLQHSLNVCLAWVSSEMGATKFYEYMERFNIGHATGIDLAGEVSGRLKIPGDADWYPIDLGTNAYGQGLSATPVQMVMAISALANDGKMVTPHVIRAVIDNGRQFNTAVQVAGTPIKAETAHTITEMLATSLETESSEALVEGYRVAGKTGTGEIPSVLGYVTGDTNASFVGWGPVEDPKFLVYVWLEKPQTSRWGSVVASPVFREVVQSIVISLNIPPDAVRNELVQR